MKKNSLYTKWITKGLLEGLSGVLACIFVNLALQRSNTLNLGKVDTIYMYIPPNDCHSKIFVVEINLSYP